MAAATSIAFLLYLTDIGKRIEPDKKFEDAIATGALRGRGRRAADDPHPRLRQAHDGHRRESGRSDTTMLLRVDPEKEFLSLLSLPRDLKVEIPGYGTDKLNAAYSYGERSEPQLTLKTVKELLGIDVNHIVNVDFEGFYDAINAIGCVYVDVDRHYFNPEGGEYDDIDIEAGYTKLCGYRALDYVRYRHNDNDLVRGARQQAFVREARQQIPPEEPAAAAVRRLRADRHLHRVHDVGHRRPADDRRDAEVVRRRAQRPGAPGEPRRASPSRAVCVRASNEDQIDTAVDQFLGNDLDEAAAGRGAARGGGGEQGQEEEEEESRRSRPSRP